MPLVKYPDNFPEDAVKIVMAAAFKPEKLKETLARQEFVQALYTLEGYALHLTVGSPELTMTQAVPWLTILQLVLSIVKKVIDDLPKSLPETTSAPAN